MTVWSVTRSKTGQAAIMLTASLCEIFIIPLVGSLYYLVADARTVVTPPAIKHPTQSVFSVCVGKPLVIPCQADPGYPDDFTLIYWLIDKTFVEMASPNGRIREEDESTGISDNEVFIQRNLSFAKVSYKDLSSNFTCIVNSPSGADKKTIRLTADACGGGSAAVAVTSPQGSLQQFGPLPKADTCLRLSCKIRRSLESIDDAIYLKRKTSGMKGKGISRRSKYRRKMAQNGVPDQFFGTVHFKELAQTPGSLIHSQGMVHNV